MIATEINPESIQLAQDFLKFPESNDLDVDLRTQNDKKAIFEGVLKEEEKVTFSMCNPPFFSSMFEREDRRSVKQVRSRATEDVTEGGEVGFITRMIKESVKFRNQITWFTTLCGRKSDYQFLITYLRSMTPHDILVTTGKIDIGHTTRWLLAWKYI